jgi:hypothetical membrane protein
MDEVDLRRRAVMRSPGREDRAVRLGALAWILAVQFFVAQIVVASAWPAPFSLRTRMISDLGNTACGPARRVRSTGVCSPWHAVMNASFVIIGITMAAGALLTRRTFRNPWPRRLAVALFVAAGAGVVLVGLYPENENARNHLVGAGVNFVAGNTALMLFGLGLPQSRSHPWLRWFSVAAGLGGLVATMLIVVHRDFGLGPGGMERIAAYTTASWQIVAGLVLWPRAGSG